jgi:transposase
MLEKQQIIISHYRLGKSQREIARTMKIHRGTIKRYIEQYEEEMARSALEGGGIVSPPKYNSRGRQKVRLTHELIDLIDHYLEQNKQKRQGGLAKQCMAGTDIYEALIKAGHQIGYTTVVRYIREQKQKGQECFIRQVYLPGSCTEFDWGMVKLNIGSKWKNLMLAVFTLSYSNYRWAFLFERQDTPSFQQAHVLYFIHIGGICGMVVYDNMRVAVAKCTIRQIDKKPTEDLLKLSAYYQFDYRFCNVARGNEKGHVEKSVEYVRRKSFSNRIYFDDLEQANDHLVKTLNDLNDKPVKGQSSTIKQNFLEEKRHFSLLPVSPFDTAVLNFYRIDKYHTISIDTNHYSVPESVHTPTIGVKIYPSRIELYDHQNHCVGSHARRHTKHEWYLEIEHYWNSLKYKPGALAHSQALDQSQPSIKSLYNQSFKDNPRAFIELMLYCKQHLITDEQLHQATLVCRERCLNSPMSSDRIIMLLQNNQLHQKTKHHPQESDQSMSTSISSHCQQQLQLIQSLLINDSIKN